MEIVEFVYCACGCGKTRSKYDKKKRLRKFLLGHCPHGGRFEDGAKHPKWNGGTYIDAQGYEVVLEKEHPHAIRGRYILKHRLVIEKQIGRYLKPDEIIHHKNGNRTDNNPSNLQIVTRSEHNKIHKSNAK